MHPGQKLQKKLLGGAGRAIADYGMIADGDRVMVGLSGGKDSYVLLDILLELRRRAPVRFDLLAVNIDPKRPGYSPQPLEEHCASRDVPLCMVQRDIYPAVRRIVPQGDTDCSLCSRLRRGALYNLAIEEKCGKIALGHHADDILQTFLLNILFEGKPRGMAPFLESADGRNTVIRPLAYCWESDIGAYASLQGYPIIACGQCGSGENLRRRRMQRLLDDLQREIPQVRHSMLAAVCRLPGMGRGAGRD